MAKAMLIMDMPSSCSECEFCRETGEDRHVCEQKVFNGRCKRINYDVENYMYEKPTWCPLREVPQKKEFVNLETAYDRIIKRGYNACIDEILGGGE